MLKVFGCFGDKPMRLQVAKVSQRLHLDLYFTVVDKNDIWALSLVDRSHHSNVIC